MNVVSLFSGIGGIELGLSRSGYHTELMCEIDPHANSILRHRFPESAVVEDVVELTSIPHAEVLTAGFPCQDVSQAGPKRGMSGGRSTLVSNVFRLIAKAPPRWLVMENVPYMLRLHQGQFMEHIVNELEEMGYRWAYRVVDSRAFGVPQRRPRILFVASKTEDPASVLFPPGSVPDIVEEKPSVTNMLNAYGFYWTEGSRGVGWAVNSVPPIKGGSGLGIPSAPAVWLPAENFVGTIDLRDAERLQGFPVDWTQYDPESTKLGSRWRMVGNAVCVPVAEWLGTQLREPVRADNMKMTSTGRSRWPTAAIGEKGRTWAVVASKMPAGRPLMPIKKFLRFELKALSKKATRGFLSRTEVCTNVNYSETFIKSLTQHMACQV